MPEYITSQASAPSQSVGMKAAIHVSQNIGFKLKFKDLRHVVDSRIEDRDQGIIAAENIMYRCLDRTTAPYRRRARFHENLKAKPSRKMATAS